MCVPARVFPPRWAPIGSGTNYVPAMYDSTYDLNYLILDGLRCFQVLLCPQKQVRRGGLMQNLADGTGG